MPKHPLRYQAGTFSIFPLMLVNFTNFLRVACTFLEHINHCLGRFFPLGGSQLESLDRPFIRVAPGPFEDAAANCIARRRNRVSDTTNGTL